LLWKTYEKQAEAGLPDVFFERLGSSIRINGTGPPVLSIYRSPGQIKKTWIDGDIRIGHPSLPARDCETQFEIIRHWLEDCDCNHRDSSCAPESSFVNQRTPSGSNSAHRLPTRVLRVGKKNEVKVYLLETTPDDKGEWIALSHQWGTGQQFRTTKDNRQDHIGGIDFAVLPDTFKHAVEVTQALGCSYLWIDSLCIVQGCGGDFNQEAKRMEQVYSGAYCVLASSRSPGHFAGFLQPRNERDSVTLQLEGASAPFYICEAIDDFNIHVLDGSLNKRGWILQEHALARHTVYFTDYQMYFECGDGVRCESMTKMDNNLAKFLGDPNFPQIIIKTNQGERILWCQDLYRKYSGMGLSQPSDRPLTIDGLQARIISALRFLGGFGIFDEGGKKRNKREFLRRSLLWRRSDDTQTLFRINFPPDYAITKVPSWSWMAYTGGTDYISPPFGDVDWQELQSPWSSSSGAFGGGSRTEDRGGSLDLIGKARDYVSLEPSDGQGEIVLDHPGGSQPLATKAIVLGVQKGKAHISYRTHYLLIIAEPAARDREGRRVYERVGAGMLPGRCVTGEPMRVKIQ
ncbi:hypothetical protein CMUS01_03421, partial [Colletotrichum musicola]